MRNMLAVSGLVPFAMAVHGVHGFGSRYFVSVVSIYIHEALTN